MATATEDKVSRSQVWKHSAMLDWLISEGHTTKGAGQVETLSAAFANRAAWRKSATYRNLLATHKETATAERTEAREARAAERAAAKAAAEAAKPAKEPKATKAAAKAEKAAPAKATKAPAKAASKAGSKSKVESPFD